MKTVILLLCFVTNVYLIQSQTFYPYNFTKLNQKYTNLSGATSLTKGRAWDDTVVVAPIGFNFKFLNNSNTADTILFSTWGFLAFRNEFYANQYLWMGRCMVPFAGNLREKSLALGGEVVSNISYQTVGDIGNRIFKLECKNIGFFDDNTGMDSLNFQVWLYETSNIIEYRYGPSRFSANSWYWQDGGCRIGMYIDVNIDTTAEVFMIKESSMITGSAANNTHITTPYDFFVPEQSRVLLGGPTDGQVFRFEPNVSSAVSDLEDKTSDVTVLFNTTVNEITISSSSYGVIDKILLLDINGKQMRYIDSPSGNQVISIADLPNNIYLLQLKCNNGKIKLFKILK